MENSNVKKAGFTLLELIIAIAIIGILAVYAVPNIINSLPDYRLRSAARDILSLMQETKLSAVKEDATAAVMFNFAQDTYFAWVNNDDAVPGTLTYDAGLGDVIFTQGTLPVGIDLYLNGSSDISNPFGFNSRGFPATGIGSIFIRNNNSNFRRVVVNLPGNIRVQTSTDGAAWVD